jgi:hypothetical protein
MSFENPMESVLQVRCGPNSLCCREEYAKAAVPALWVGKIFKVVRSRKVSFFCLANFKRPAVTDTFSERLNRRGKKEREAPATGSDSVSPKATDFLSRDFLIYILLIHLFREGKVFMLPVWLSNTASERVFGRGATDLLSIRREWDMQAKTEKENLSLLSHSCQVFSSINDQLYTHIFSPHSLLLNISTLKLRSLMLKFLFGHHPFSTLFSWQSEWVHIFFFCASAAASGILAMSPGRL